MGAPREMWADAAADFVSLALFGDLLDDAAFVGAYRAAAGPARGRRPSPGCEDRRVRLTERGLNRATLARQLLLGRQALSVIEAITRVGALQAQEPASPYLALWNRLDPFDPAELDAAFATHAVVKATLMRITLHAVPAADYPAFHAAMQPTLRASRLNDGRFTETGLSAAQADAVLPHLPRLLAEARSNAEIDALLSEHLGRDANSRIWWALRSYAPVVHAPAAGTWTFGPRPAYLTAPGDTAREDPEVAAPRLARRYLEAFGPASVADLARFAMIPRSRARTAIQALDDLVTLDGPDGKPLFDVPGGPLPDEDTPAPPRLLPMWDSVLLAYEDRSRIVPPAHRALVVRNNGDVLPTVLVDGYVAGVWRPVTGGLEITPFAPLTEATWAALAAEARTLTGFLADRDPAVYSRYGHWWRKLPPGPNRVIRSA